MRRLLPLALLFAVCATAGAQTADAQKDSSAAVAKFDKALPGYSADVRKDADFLRGLLKDYYLHRDDLTASECEVAEALLSDLGLSEFGSRGGFSELYAKSKPAAPAAKPAPVAKPAPAPAHVKPHGGGSFGSMYGKPVPHTPPPPKPAPVPATVVKRVAKISGLRSKPTFASGVNNLPGGNAVGYVTLAIDGKRKRIVEVPGTKALDPGKRAATIAARLRSVAAADSLWWMKLRVGTEKGEAILKVPGSGIDHILTADKAFAKEWGSTPEALAARLRTKIRNAYDDLGADRFSTRGGDERDAAIEARQEGDELAADDAEGAMTRYRASIVHDKTYLVPYLRIADLYRTQGKGGEADAILRQAADAEGMSDEDKKTATAGIKG